VLKHTGFSNYSRYITKALPIFLHGFHKLTRTHRRQGRFLFQFRHWCHSSATTSTHTGCKSYDRLFCCLILSSTEQR
jgi:hypothetical protein